MKALSIMLLAIVAVFAPTKQVVLTVMALSGADLISGILASRKVGVGVRSAGLKRTVLKLFVYEAATLCAFLVQVYLTGPDMPVMNWLSALIGLTELKSILENLDIVAGGSFFTSLTNKLAVFVSNGIPPKD